ncbi:hypothetical protein HPP92_010083 [Vanilla planifolia]|uniref:Uncharacterized protein n=1 Tax=Vanilla planifolia TaxID=51239 RepID=A0A835QT78_VANPL|nr:hypothetical protein HPP92_010083 [Vanilla planifolia]
MEEEEVEGATTSETPPRASPKASPQLNRWSRARALLSGHRLDWSALRNKTTSSSPPSPASLSSSSMLDEKSPSISSEEHDRENDEEEPRTPRPGDGKAIYMVSDGTGSTAENSVNAALGQFEHCLVDRGCPVSTHLFSGKIATIVSQGLNPVFPASELSAISGSENEMDCSATGSGTVTEFPYPVIRLSVQPSDECHDLVRENKAARLCPKCQIIESNFLRGISYVTSPHVCSSARIDKRIICIQRKGKHGIRWAKVNNMDRLIEIIKQAAKEGAILLYTLADPSMADTAKQACKVWGVPSTDILRPTIEAIANHIGVAPSGIPRGAPGRKPLNEDYFKRIEAIDFTIKQDDGALPQNLNRAHIVLVGVSRTGKTPLSIYLAQKGYMVANVPIVMGVELPKALFDINQEKIFGLTINPVVLQTIRKARAKTLGFQGEMKSNYSNMEHVRAELNYANKIFAQNPVWPVIEVTGKAIEETAAVVVRIHHDRKKKCFIPRISKRY